MGKLHELLAVEETVVKASEKLLAETSEKFNKHTEYFTGAIRTLTRLKNSPEDQAIEVAQRQEKALPTDVIDTLDYILPYVEKTLALKLSKHLTNQRAVADVVMEDGQLVLKSAPVDFLLDLEKMIPKWRAMFQTMPTLDPSREWDVERKGVWRARNPVSTSQTEKVMYPVIMAEATDKHPAQVKEATKDMVVGTFTLHQFSGAATSQQKADALALCDKLLSAVKQARMRANSVEQVEASGVRTITDLLASVFK